MEIPKGNGFTDRVIRESELEVQSQGVQVAEGYVDTLRELVSFQTDQVVHFYGSELDLQTPNRSVWMSPAEVDDGENYTYFQLLYVNTRPEDAIGNPDIDTYLLDIDETSFKLANESHSSHRALNHLLSGDEPKLLIRWCKNGMAYFPRAVTPHNNREVALGHLDTLTSSLGVRNTEVAMSLSKVSDKQPLDLPHNDHISISHARSYDFEGTDIYTYGLILDDDPWKYYDIFTPQPLDSLEKSDLLVRLDSGCDIGQIYNDKGCDCREQLHTALTDMLVIGQGMVIHVPGQDGRGYGAATKMETEGLKRGIPVATNVDDLAPMDTITAARHLFGDRYDIRTYDGAGRILAAMGISSVILQTDNRLKAEGLTQGGIAVRRKPTNTTGAGGSWHHIQAKHRETDIYYGEDES